MADEKQFQEGDTLGGGNPQMSRMMQDIFIRTLVMNARLNDKDPEDVAEVLTTPSKSEEFHEEVIKALSELEDDEMDEEIKNAVEEAKEEIEKEE